MSTRRGRRARSLTSAAAALAVAAAAVGLALHWDLLELAPAQDADEPAEATSATVAYVIDGDTIAANLPGDSGDPQRIRLLGINTPEVSRGDSPGECGAEDATAQLEELLPEGAPIRLASDSRADDADRYERLLRYVELEDGTDAGHALIEKGLAVAWAPAGEPTPERLPDYEDATSTAREAQTGLWATCPRMPTTR
ncbi:MAG TPA: thermonuclease family protein [Brachybacterium paraconglomeratum]|uniref:Thermonuclease family protein n=1 Tax=Brachybacterium paraconglomeratum TaxID=173362 RepID=A0A921GP64_9MICO|nr:thermonuclease family protein [Brachybacterium paraconglomeratum]